VRLPCNSELGTAGALVSVPVAQVRALEAQGLTSANPDMSAG